MYSHEHKLFYPPSERELKSLLEGCQTNKLFQLSISSKTHHNDVIDAETETRKPFSLHHEVFIGIPNWSVVVCLARF